jgi:hypothetical protein
VVKPGFRRKSIGELVENKVRQLKEKITQQRHAAPFPTAANLPFTLFVLSASSGRGPLRGSRWLPLAAGSVPLRAVEACVRSSNARCERMIVLGFGCRSSDEGAPPRSNRRCCW